MLENTRLVRFVLYAMVGAIGTAAHYAILFGTVSMGWLAPVTGSMCGATAGAAINFWLNARVTFRSGTSWSTARRFAATTLLAAGANGLAMAGLVGWFQVAYLSAQVVVTGGLLVLTFLVNSLWTFRFNRTS